MALDDCDFPPLLNTSDDDIIADFFVPALRNSVRYDRGVGFFSAGWPKALARSENPEAAAQHYDV